jgi:hypothetical protein
VSVQKSTHAKDDLKAKPLEETLHLPESPNNPYTVSQAFSHGRNRGVLVVKRKGQQSSEHAQSPAREAVTTQKQNVTISQSMKAKSTPKKVARRKKIRRRVWPEGLALQKVKRLKRSKGTSRKRGPAMPVAESAGLPGNEHIDPPNRKTSSTPLSRYLDSQRK